MISQGSRVKGSHDSLKKFGQEILTFRTFHALEEKVVTSIYDCMKSFTPSNLNIFSKASRNKVHEIRTISAVS